MDYFFSIFGKIQWLRNVEFVVDLCKDDKDDSWQLKDVKEQEEPFARMKITSNVNKTQIESNKG